MLAYVRMDNTASLVYLASNETAKTQYGVGHVIHRDLKSKLICANIEFVHESSKTSFLIVREIVVMGQKLSGTT